MAIVPQLTHSTPDKTLPARFRELQRLGQHGIRRAVAFTRSEPDVSHLTTSLLSAGSQQAIRPNSRASVLSLTTLSAWNRTSMLSTTDVSDRQIEYRIHRTSSTTSITSSSTQGSISTASIGENITEISCDIPDASSFEIASAVHGYIPPLKTFAISSPEPTPQESWTQFIERVLQPDACQPSSARRLSSSELDSPTAPITDRDLFILQGPNKWTEDEWVELEQAVVKEAQLVKEKDTKVIQRGDIRLVNVSKPKQHHPSLDSPAYQRNAFSSADVSTTQSILDVLGKIVTRTKSVDGLKHDALPYQPYSQPFSPFNQIGAADAEAPIRSLSKSDRRKCSLVQSNSNIELHLPPTPALATPNKPSSEISTPSAIHRISWLDTSDALPEIVPTTTDMEQEQGLVTRKLTNAGPTTPKRVVMNSAYPVFPINPYAGLKDNRRHSCPVLCNPIAVPATEVIISPKPEIALSARQHVAGRSESLETFSVDSTTGVLTRADTVAKERHNNEAVLRTVMNQSYPVFLKRGSSDDTQISFARAGVRVKPRLVRTRTFNAKRLSLPIITEMATPPSTTCSTASSPANNDKRKDSGLTETNVTDFASTFPEITVTSPSIASSGSVTRSNTVTSNVESTSDDAPQPSTMEVLLASTVSTPISTTAHTADTTGASAPCVPTGPSSINPRVPRKLIKRRPVSSGPVRSSQSTLLSLPGTYDLPSLTTAPAHHPKSFASRMAKRHTNQVRSSDKKKGKAKGKYTTKAASESLSELNLSKEMHPMPLGCHLPGRRDYVSEGVPGSAGLGEWGLETVRAIEGRV
ncbi:hypothetical protein CAC42_4904 [Sphaceloma murrayae]|uniref:Uncharacterized protein n=1 Tax=Sphaceloma murrayae TaxID=2082308 RepID=A0A2K1QPT9_9PEZI|nr:hypothetical protein CAC42_4904 [Sphaceloma murrayae]